MLRSIRRAAAGGGVALLSLALGGPACEGSEKMAEPDTGPREAFHLYLLIGQSNMAGRGKVAEEDKQPHPRVLALNRDDRWVPAVDPLHFDKPMAGVGPGLSFGKAMATADAAARIGLIPCAAGGSPISVWQPGASWNQTRSKPYDEALRRTKIALRRGVLKGILWHQGESDSSPELAAAYEERLLDLIARLRKDLEAPEVPFIVGGLGDFVVRPAGGKENPGAARVSEALQRVARKASRVAYVDPAGLGHKGDGVHFSAESARELGRRYAKALLALVGP